ncbi:MAG TPA: SMC-Scp complex subunit ScpB [Amnibacterium sp.]|nr:SMC-Scp complex subunit ScpB [Amnibacterium sp.]
MSDEDLPIDEVLGGAEDVAGDERPAPAEAAPAEELESADLPPVRAALEAVLLVVDEPVAEVVLAQVVERPTEEIAALLRELAAEYDADGRGFELRNLSGGWRLYTRASCAPFVERFVRDGQQARLTQAALETLAVVAYRQPVSRSRVAAIRGVNVEGVMRTLVSRGLVTEVGNEPESGAVLYGTTPFFLERLGVSSIEELPPVSDFLPDPYSLDEEDVSTSS